MKIYNPLVIKNCIDKTNKNLYDGYLPFILMQSNGTSRFSSLGNLPSQMQGIQMGNFTFHKPVNDNSNNGNWEPLEAGVNDSTGAPQIGKFGIDCVMGYRLFNTYGKECYNIPAAVGGAYIANDVTPSYNVNHINDYYIRATEVHFNQAYQKIRATKILKPFMLIIHGESDADSVSHGLAYYLNMSDYINKTRISTGFLNMPVIITKIRSDYGGAMLGLSLVRQAQIDLANNITNVFLFDTENPLYPLSSDGQHYNPIIDNFVGTQSAVNLGNSLADFVDKYIKPIDQSMYWKQGIAKNINDIEATALINAMSVKPNLIREQLIKDFL